MIEATVVIAHYKEDLKWIDDIDRSRYRVCVVSKTLPTSDNIYIHQSINVGNEASAYLEYIIRDYDNLSTYTVFVHGHEYSYHHNGRMQDLLNKEIVFTHSYFNICCRARPLLYIKKDGIWREKLAKVIPEHIDVAHPFEIPDGVTDFATKLNAQFYVHRDLIRRHPKELYEQLLHKMQTDTRNSHSLGLVYEYLWHYIFTGCVIEPAEWLL